MGCPCQGGTANPNMTRTTTSSSKPRKAPKKHTWIVSFPGKTPDDNQIFSGGRKEELKAIRAAELAVPRGHIRHIIETVPRGEK